MNTIEQIEREEIAKLTDGKDIPVFGPGDTVRVQVRVVEGTRERLQAFEGVCIARSNGGLHTSFTVRKISNGEGVERVFQLYSPLIQSIEKALQHLSVDTEQLMDEVIVRTDPESLIETCKLLRETAGLEFNYLRCLSAVDYVENIEVVYHLSSLEHPHKTVIKTQVLTKSAELPSVVQIWRGADWHEREVHDLFGMAFTNHPNMSPLLLFEGFEGFPLRKSYKIPEQKEGLGG